MTNMRIFNVMLFFVNDTIRRTGTILGKKTIKKKKKTYPIRFE